MNYKNLLIIVGLVLIILVILLILSFNIIRKDIEKNHNAKINFSCLKDSDCSIKYIGCDICYGKKRGCINMNSVEGWCLRKITFEQKITCQASSVPPTSCSCVNNTCKSNYDY